MSVDSKVDFGELPVGWETARIKWILKSLESGRREVDENNSFDEQVLSIGGEHLGWHGEWYLENSRYISFEQYDALNSGKIQPSDVLLVKDGATIGKVAIADNMPEEKMAVNEHVFIMRFFENDDPRYYFYFFQSFLAQDQLQLEVRGSAQPGLNSEFRQTLSVPHPPFEKQKSIVDYLDRETTRIDALISAKERLLELLEEKRRALITHAVTKGLDPNAPMRDSGVPWIGEIPKHWEVKKLKYVAALEISNVDKHTVEGQAEVKLCNYIDVYRNEKISCKIDFMISTAATDQIVRLSIKKDDVLLTKDSETPDDIGVPALVVEDFTNLVCGYHLALARPSPNIMSGGFLHRVIQAEFTKGYYFSESVGMTRYGLDKLSIANTMIPAPPISEQEEILGYINSQADKMDSLSIATQQTISLLKERRAALIAEAVTGKITDFPRTQRAS